MGNENDDDMEEEEQDEDGSEFEEGIVDVSGNEILYDNDGNVIGEDDIAKGLKEIVEYHMNKLKKRLDVFDALARIQDINEDKEDKETKIEAEKYSQK